jgi:hypothetical protein
MGGKELLDIERMPLRALEEGRLRMMDLQWVSVYFRVFLVFFTSLDPRAVCPLKGGLPSREAKKLRGQHDLHFAEEATRASEF